jgi:excisionase family DNA binding protein
VPDLLTVEEAAAVLRIGRTKAYAMAREGRRTGGRSGLPVLDFGNVLRVPRHALEELIGAPIQEIRVLDAMAGPEPPGDVGVPVEPAPTPTPAPEPDVTERSRERRRRQRRRARSKSADQLDLFELPPSA